MILHGGERLSEDRLPDIGAWSTQCRARGARTLQAAGKLLQELPYGRLGDGCTYRDVLREGRGTSSTKHAALAEIAAEARVDALLDVGVYDMCEANTPGVSPVLAATGLASMPEAHCNLILDGERIDITCRRHSASYDIGEVHDEFIVEPAGLATHKETIHREVLHAWMRVHLDRVAGRDEEAMWAIREACIAAVTE